MSRYRLVLAAAFSVLTAFLIHHALGQSSPGLRSPERLTASGWRLAWSAESGVIYRLERTSALLDINTIWQPVATVTATNGVVVADDLTDPAAQARFYRVIPIRDAIQFTIGTVSIRSELATTNGTSVLLSGSVQVGQSRIVSPTPSVLDLATHHLTGSGSATGSGGAVISGSFDADLDRGQMRFTGDPDAFSIGDLVLIDPRSVTLDLNTGSFAGSGVVSIQLPAVGGAAPGSPPVPFSNAVSLDGDFESNPPSDRIHFTGTASYRGLSVEGSGDLQSTSGTFVLTGKVRVSGGETTTYLLEPGSVTLNRHVDGSVEFSVEGQSGITPLGAGRLTGTMSLGGTVSLGWTGTANVSGIQVPGVTVRLDRPGTAGAPATLKLKMDLTLPQVSGAAVTAEILPDGTLSALTSTGGVQFGALQIRPKTSGTTFLPVLTLTRSDADHLGLRVQGEFLTPEAAGTKPVAVDGELVLTDLSTTLRVESLRVTNSIPLVQWPLPQQIKLTDVSLLLYLSNAEYQAHLIGSLVLAATTAKPITLTLDAALIANPTDPEDVGIDTALRAQRLNLFDQVYLADAQFRLQVSSKPATGSLALINSSAGFFPNFPAATPPPLLQRSDFNLFAANVGATLRLSEQG